MNCQHKIKIDQQAKLIVFGNQVRYLVLSERIEVMWGQL